MTTPVWSLPPLSSGFTVAGFLAMVTRPWSNWFTALWQQIAYLFTLQATVATTNATITTIATIVIPSGTTVMIEAKVVARRTGGSAGTAEDGAGYVIYAAYKNAAGTATEIGETAVFTAEDQAGWTCGISGSGANALIRVTGAANNNIDWMVMYRTTMMVS